MLIADVVTTSCFLRWCSCTLLCVVVDVVVATAPIGIDTRVSGGIYHASKVHMYTPSFFPSRGSILALNVLQKWDYSAEGAAREGTERAGQHL